MEAAADFADFSVNKCVVLQYEGYVPVVKDTTNNISNYVSEGGEGGIGQQMLHKQWENRGHQQQQQQKVLDKHSFTAFNSCKNDYNEFENNNNTNNNNYKINKNDNDNDINIEDKHEHENENKVNNDGDDVDVDGDDINGGDGDNVNVDGDDVNGRDGDNVNEKEKEKFESSIPAAVPPTTIQIVKPIPTPTSTIQPPTTTTRTILNNDDDAVPITLPTNDTQLRIMAQTPINILEDEDKEKIELIIKNNDDMTEMMMLRTLDDGASLQPLSERWSPLGANYDDAMSPTSELKSPESELELPKNDSLTSLDKQLVCSNETSSELARLRNIEEEQELLTTSLMALTSQFAHVQLRVRQIVEAPAQERDQLLRDLEDFAFQGIPDPSVAITKPPKLNTNTLVTALPVSGNPENQESQCLLIDQLKSQLNELEQTAYESGAPVLPQHMLLEKQKMIINELKSKLNIKVDDAELSELSTEELKNQVENAIGEFVGPLKMKEQLVAQLKTQITDLERFIAFLQCDSEDSRLKLLSSVDSSDKLYEAYNSYAAKKKKQQQQTSQAASREQKLQQTISGESGNLAGGSTDAVDAVACNLNGSGVASGEALSSPASGSGFGIRESLQSKAHGLLDKASMLMQMFASTHFSHTKCEHFHKNSLKKTSKGNHWGDLRAQLEVDIQEVASLAATLSCDREKLANVKRVLSQQHKRQQQQRRSKPSLNANNGAVTPVRPPQLDARRHKTNDSMTLARGIHELVPYQSISSDSDEDAQDRYDWEKSCAHRVLHMRGDSIATISKELTSVVRKNFARTLQQLIQHGLRVETESTTSSLIVPFMRCLNPMPSSQSSSSSSSSAAAKSFGTEYQTSPFLTAHMPDVYTGDASANYDDVGHSSIFGYGRPMHAWELILEYYYLKHGDDYNNTPARKLSQSFNLDIVDSGTRTSKQSLLSAVGIIVATHRPYKRSYNAHFKAFVCAGLNSHLLVEWLNLILSCSELIEIYYAQNSYVARTGFRDSLRSIDALTKFDFDLPVDLAIRHFKNI